MPDLHLFGRALTLSERDSLFASGRVPEGFDPELARRRLERWRAESALGDDRRFAFRLEQEGLDPSQLERLLGSPAPAPGHAPWLRQLEAIYRTAGAGGMPDDALISADVEELPESVFLAVVRPFLDHAWRRLRAAMDAAISSPQSSDSAPLDLAHFAILWSSALPTQLLRLVARSLILELYIHRIEGTLVGETPEARFRSFVEPLAERQAALELWARYPVLARALVDRVDQWVAAGTELAERLAADLPALREAFGVLGELTELESALGDRHAGGRAVVCVGFASGVKVVYKPRSLELDRVFRQLVEWFGEQGLEARLRAPQVLCREGYGWAEHVERIPCRDARELRRFYARQGVYLALLYALEATDFHHENLIAVGEHPMLIDLETLFQPILLDAETSRADLNPVASTVLRSGLLPRQSWGEVGLEGFDLSGLGARHGQLVPVRELSRPGTDEMGFADRMAERPAGRHLPQVEDERGRVETVELWEHAETIVESFTTAYRRLCELRPAFLEPGGWLDRFADLETRVILRSTGLYVRLLEASYHPDFLQDALQREILLDKLWLDAERFPYIPDLVPLERFDLGRGDVPRFASRTDSRDLESSTGAPIQGALHRSGLELARLRFEALGEDDLERQLALVRMALASVRPPAAEAGLPSPAWKGATIGPDPAAEGPPQDLGSGALAAALRVGERLERLAFRAEGWISWFHLRPAAEGRQALEPVGPDLYAGLGGIALFLAQLGRMTGELRFGELARDAVSTARDLVERQPDFRRKLGAYAGLGGWIYVLTYLGVLWRSESLLDEAEAEREGVKSEIEDDDGLDLISGSAGCLAALLGLHRHRPSGRTLEMAMACGDHLLRRAEVQEHGRAWRLPDLAAEPLTGFAHGTAGIAWALAKLAAATGEERFAEAARDALAYERHHFSPAHDNWPDLRFDRRSGTGDDEGWAYFHAWCHGSPGIGLSRLDLLRSWRGDTVDRADRLAEIRAALRSTRRHGFGHNHCLCHGDLGNLELLTRAARELDPTELGIPDLRAAVRSRTSHILESLETDGYRCGLHRRVDLPGLLTGLAGIGYGLLQLAHPEAVPSVLLLETPA
ncbi:MAG: type 2 lantipeptide synthetase LanM family protein [Holophagales bacterium]|nr:type 2 lantipeptide synthetase LanM family protein [Holophagales bacterium]